MNTLLSIIIPTIRVDNDLHRAINSARRVGAADLEILVSLNGIVEPTSLKRFTDDGRVRFCSTGEIRLPSWDSFSFAMSQARGQWLFLLSADDWLPASFLDCIDLRNLSDDTLITFPLFEHIENSNSSPTRSNVLSAEVFDKAEAAMLFAEGKFRQNLSLFVFSRTCYANVGGYVNVGFPNGYYDDTLFHAKLIEASEKVRYVSDGTSFVNRTISTSQASAKFYRNPRLIRNSLANLAREYCRLPMIRDSYISKLCVDDGHLESTLLRHLINERIGIDFYKLSRFYQASFLKRLHHGLSLVWAGGSLESVVSGLAIGSSRERFLSKVASVFRRMGV